MLNVQKEFKDGTLTVHLDGEINTGSADIFNEAVADLDNVNKLVLNFEKVQYISSAGLRVLVKSQNTMDDKEGSMIIKGVNEDVYDVLDMTSLTEIMTIETI